MHVGDITRNDYDLEFCYDRKFNPKVTILYFYWNVSEKAENMLESHFITEFQIIIEPLQLNYSNSITHVTENMKITLNESLQPNQWYMTIGRMLTGDNDTWQPESVHKYFRTCESSKNQFDYSNNLTTDLMENKVITLNETLQLSQWYLVIGRILTIDNDTWGPESVYKYFETFPPGNVIINSFLYQVHPGFLRLLLSVTSVCACVCLCLYVLPQGLLTSGVI